MKDPQKQVFWDAVVRTISLTHGPSAMAFGNGAVCVTKDIEDSVLRIRPRSNSIVRAISVGSDPVAFAVGADAIWVVHSCDGTVSRIDPATNTVTDTVRVGHRPLGVAVAPGLVWVTVRAWKKPDGRRKLNGSAIGLSHSSPKQLSGRF